MSSSSSSSSSLSVSTPSSIEHAARRQIPSTSTQLPRRTSVSTPGAPITLVLNKVKEDLFSFFFYFYVMGSLFSFQDQKGSFGLTVTQHDHGTWVQSVQPHGPADQVNFLLEKAYLINRFCVLFL